MKREFLPASSPPFSLHVADGPRKGFAENFRSLLSNDAIEADYFAFCDQDDLWEAGKLETAKAEAWRLIRAHRRSLSVGLGLMMIVYLLIVRMLGGYSVKQFMAGIREPQTYILNHGYCYSLYVKDPADLIIEFTVDHEDVDKINRDQAAKAHRELKRWLGGDHTPNNEAFHR